MSQESRQVGHIMHMILGAIILLGTVLRGILASTGPDGFANLVDLPSALWIGGILVGGLWLSFGPMTTSKAFAAMFVPGYAAVPEACATYLMVFTRAYQLAWASGLAGMLINVIVTVQNMQDPSYIGPALALSLLAPLYGALLAEFVFAPLRQVLVNRAIVNKLNLPIPLEPYRSYLWIGVSVALFLFVMIFILLLATVRFR